MIAGIETTFIPLSFSELTTKAVHLYGPPVSNSRQFNTQYQPFPCLKFTCRGKIKKLWFVARSFQDAQPPTLNFHILRKYQGPQYCSDTDSPGSNCEYHQWLVLNWNRQQPCLVYGNDIVGIYETTLPTNNSFEIGDILGVDYPANAAHQVLYQREGVHCDTLGKITIHSFTGPIQYPPLDPVLPYIAIETGQ